MLELNCQLFIRNDLELKLTLMKVCPSCGAENDLGDWLTRMGTATQTGAVIPTCGLCDFQIWKNKSAAKRWANRRYERGLV
jgi:hypothetical protein